MLRFDWPVSRWTSLFGFVLAVSYAQAAWANGTPFPPRKQAILKPPLKIDPKPDSGNISDVLRQFEIHRDPNAKQVTLRLPMHWLTKDSVVTLGDSLNLSAAGPRTPTIVAGMALSLVVTLGGIAVLGGRGRTVVMKYGVYLLGLVVAICGGYASANMASPGARFGNPVGPRPLPTGLQAPLLPSSIADPPQLPASFLQTAGTDATSVVFRAPVVVEFVDMVNHGILILDNDSSWLSFGDRGINSTDIQQLRVERSEPTLPPQLQSLYDKYERLHPNLKE